MASISFSHEIPWLHLAIQNHNSATLRQLNIRTIHLAAGHGRNCFPDASAVVDASGRHRLAETGAHLGAAARSVSDKCDSPVFMRVSYQFSSHLHGILRPWIAHPLPDLDSLDVEALKALAIRHRVEIAAHEPRSQPGMRRSQSGKLRLHPGMRRSNNIARRFQTRSRNCGEPAANRSSI